MDLGNKNYYEVLEIPTNASQDDIQRAYLQAKNAYSGESAALYSLMSEAESKNILGQIEEAFAVLGIPEKRRLYDKNKGIGDFATQSTRSGWASQLGEASEEYATSGKSDGSEGLAPSEQYQQEQLHETDFQMKSNMKDAHVSKVAALKKYQLDYSVDPDFEREIEHCKEFNGAFLKKIREYKNVSIERMADMTRVSKNYLRAIESESWDQLPAPVYIRGFIFQYAKCLKLNPNYVATSFLHHLKRQKDQQVS